MSTINYFNIYRLDFSRINDFQQAVSSFTDDLIENTLRAQKLPNFFFASHVFGLLFEWFPHYSKLI
jgi:hypothetical protein